jgi:hypothetical protein
MLQDPNSSVRISWALLKLLTLKRGPVQRWRHIPVYRAFTQASPMMTSHTCVQSLHTGQSNDDVTYLCTEPSRRPVQRWRHIPVYRALTQASPTMTLHTCVQSLHTGQSNDDVTYLCTEPSRRPVQRWRHIPVYRAFTHDRPQLVAQHFSSCRHSPSCAHLRASTGHFSAGHRPSRSSVKHKESVWKRIPAARNRVKSRTAAASACVADVGCLGRQADSSGTLTSQQWLKTFRSVMTPRATQTFPSCRTDPHLLTVK